MIDGAGAGATSWSTAVSTPFWLTLTTLQPGSPLRSSATRRLTSLITVGAKRSSVGISSACGVITTPGSGPSSGAMRLLSSRRSVMRSRGPVNELVSSASSCGSLKLSSNGCSTSITVRAVLIRSGPASFASSA